MIRLRGAIVPAVLRQFSRAGAERSPDGTLDAAGDGASVETYLRERIPLSRAMEVRVVEIGATHLRVAAPLAPNINHRDTVFGGSAAAVAMLAAWGLLYVRLDREQRPARLVIQRCSMEYLQPIDAEFAAVSTLAADWSASRH